MLDIKKVVKKGDYNYAVVYDHPYANKYGYVLEHRIVMENSLGRILDKSEIVHHIDGNKRNNEITNLVVLGSSDHIRLHHRIHGRRYVKVLCPNCLNVFDMPENQLSSAKGSDMNFCSRRCNGQYHYMERKGLLKNEQRIAATENIIKRYIRH